MFTSLFAYQLPKGLFSVSSLTVVFLGLGGAFNSLAQVTECAWLDKHKSHAVERIPALIARDARLKGWEFDISGDIFSYRYYRNNKICGIPLSATNRDMQGIVVKFDDWSLEFIEIEIISAAE